ncbi:uncharacterized protein LOC106646585 [Copidosoma floridanum]|uniref:uncharacterized protein LOC106646585 n=1 Tax=Copidosoma floridanum TaxID=29053 RepID=UPI0006C95941|nr:uncharacterized protein LOC106646585 [Copidosoma floridanum]XP_014218123.1 uncharacterized protein LOC106646585 [Copidosoma floridanum]XP_014218124.1 uncharacterized protein LOC106646585 [Copidosoma floridanum]XP_014218125.1 uncharacterized protein LOC106646585 [Copidosoma floridanum]
MPRPILSRPRTRVYGCNYDKGESYYKPTIENLDRKYSGRPLFAEPRNSLADEIAARRSDIGTRDLAGSRTFDLDFEPAPTKRHPVPLLPEDEDFVFDVRGQKTSRGGAARRLGESLEREFLGKESGHLRRADQLLEELRQPTAKWTRLTGDEDGAGGSGAAADRARKSKARLSDLEHEMEEMAEKQARREKRAAALRALVSETAAMGDDVTSSMQSVHQQVHRSEKTEKHVSF